MSRPDCIDHGKKGDSRGYTSTRLNSFCTTLHRIVYAKHHGLDLSALKGLVVRHTCDNPRCINTDHLLIGTNADNSNDISERRRAAHLKLTVEQVAEIRNTCRPNKYKDVRPNPFSYCALAKKFGVHAHTIKQVHLGLKHKGVKTDHIQTNGVSA